MKFKDYYETMGVTRDVDDKTLKSAYRRLARKFHPDVSEELDAEAKFKAIGEAYEVLKDPEKRAAYDLLGPNWQAGQDFRPPPNRSDIDWAFDETRSFGTAGFDADGFSEFFHSMFGEPHRARDGAHTRSRQRKGRDLHTRLAVTLEELYAGGPVELTLLDPATGAERCLRVTVPKHVRSGQSFRLRGQGAASGSSGVPAGDLYVELSVVPHPEFRVVGNDIHSVLEVAPWEAVLGTQVSVNTLGGPIKLSVPQGSRTGNKLRVKNRGLPGVQAGHQFVTLTVQVPSVVTAAERAHYKALAELSSTSVKEAT